MDGGVTLNVYQDILFYISGMVRKLIIIILIPVVVIAGFMFWIVGKPVLAMQYTILRINQVLDSVPERELIARTADLPEVKAFLGKYENPRTIIDTDFHVAVLYYQCRMIDQVCQAGPAEAYLDVRIDLDTGYPERSIFWCRGERIGSFPLGDEALIQHIQDC
ncbi:MAG: hypothetical protein AB1351_02405 [Thermoproteota archaeon]